MMRPVLAAALLALAPAGFAQDRLPQIAFSPCRLEHVARVSAAAAQCGTLRVPENPAAPEGRAIEIFIALVPAISLRKAPDPLFLIAGGPGQSTADLYTFTSAAFERIRRDHDIVLVDQRGTGKSNRLDCDLGETGLLEIDPDFDIASTSRQCRDALAKKADVGQYTTSSAVRDLDAVRLALGYAQINIYGVSYGTRVAQHYARRYPAATRTLILDGVVAPQNVLGPAIAIDAERALERILARCTKDPACAKAFPDPLADYHQLRDALTKQPVRVSVPDTTGKAQDFQFTSRHLSAVLRLASYSDDQAALLPLSLHLAQREGNYIPLANQFRVIARSLVQAFAYGMHNSVTCNEDAALIKPEMIDSAALASTHMGGEAVKQLIDACREWPRGPVDKDLHAPLASRVPALLLSGSDDPVTPPHYAELARRAFPDSLHVVLTGHGHGQAGAPCVDRLMFNFVSAGTAQSLDAACTKKIAPMAFFTTLAGPAP
jgi:pimeloyl-ACP methyl ester carboxylesterase